MFELIYGLSGSGKTYEITERIKKALSETEDSIFLIVPEQLVLTSERKMLSSLPASAQLRLNVVSFSRLANFVFRRFGGLSYNYITPGAKNLLTWLAIKESSPSFREYDINISSDDAFPRLMRATISELKAACITPQDLGEAVGKLSDSSVANKLFDIATIYTVYESLLAEKYDDASDDLSKLSKILKEKNFFGHCRVYFDAFKGFTVQELRVIEEIFKQAEYVCISLCTDKPRSHMPHFMTASDTASRLKRMATRIIGAENIREYILKDIKRTSSRELTFLNENILRYELTDGKSNTVPQQKRGDIEIYACDSTYSEAEMIGNYILRAVQNGYRYRDIAVIFRDAGSRAGIIDTAFEKLSIPSFMSVGSDISSKPVIKLVLSALRVKVYNYNRHDVMSFIKTGLVGISPMDSDIFEDYITTWNIRGSGYASEWKMNPDGYKAEFSDRSKRILGTAENIRRYIFDILSPFCRALDEAKCGEDITLSIYELLKALNISDRLTELAEKEASLGFVKDADETLQVFNILIGTLADINNIIGKRKTDASEYLTVLKMILEDTEIGTIPTSSDQVTVGSANLLRLDGIKLAFVAGMVEGEFPKIASESPVLTDTDKERLKDIGIELSANKDFASSDELFFTYSALTVPSEKLIVSYPMANAAGKAFVRSSVLNRMLLLFDYIPLINYDKLAPEKRLYSPRSAFEYLSRRDGDKSAAIKASLKCIDEYKDILPLLDIKISDSSEKLSADTIKMLFNRKIRLTQSKLEKYVKCRMSYYCKYILKLRPHSVAAFSANDIGTLVHNILENVLRYLTAKRRLKGENAISDVELDGIIEITASEFVADAYPDEALESNRLRHLISKLSRLSGIVLKQIIEEFRESDFMPEFFELAINENSEYGLKPYEIRLNSGERVIISGVADRVDVYRNADDIYIRVIDYKTGNKTFALSDIKRGTNLQAILYLFALCECNEKLWKEKLGANADSSVRPAAAVYLSVNITPTEAQKVLQSGEIPENALDDFKYKGIMTDREDVLRAASHTLSYKVIPGKYKAKKQTQNKYLLSDEGFEEIFSQIESVITDISQDILKGNASSFAYSDTCELAPDKKTCEYCEFASICRFERDKTAIKGNGGN